MNKIKKLVNVVVISKPIQFVNILNYLDNEINNWNNVNYELYIVDSFWGAKELKNKVKNLNLFYNVYLIKSYWSLLPNLFFKKIENLFIDSDIGFKNNLILLLAKAKSVFVYEEGIGTTNKAHNFGPGNLFSSYLGESPFTDHLIVYNPEDVVSKIERKVLKIEKNLQEYILDNIEVMKRVMLNDNYDRRVDYLKGDVTVYFSAWSMDVNFIKNHKGRLIVREHPHRIGRQNKFNYVQLNKFFLGELELLDLSMNKNIKYITVYSHNSSIKKYLKNKKIEFLDIA